MPWLLDLPETALFFKNKIPVHLLGTAFPPIICATQCHTLVLRSLSAELRDQRFPNPPLKYLSQDACGCGAGEQLQEVSASLLKIWRHNLGCSRLATPFLKTADILLSIDLPGTDNPLADDLAGENACHALPTIPATSASH